MRCLILPRARRADLSPCSARRFARIRLIPSPPEQHPPISALGFDPLLSLPSREDFTSLLRARPRSTIKGVVMDQAFSAGVGNWVADEVLFQARLHPALPVSAMTDEDVGRLYEQIREVPRIAVEVDANHSKFPKRASRSETERWSKLSLAHLDWLFTWRWSKGKKDKNRKLKTDGSGGMQLVRARLRSSLGIALTSVTGRLTAGRQPSRSSQSAAERLHLLRRSRRCPKASRSKRRCRGQRM